MTLLYDSDNPDSIPDGVAAAGYCDGYAASGWNAKGWSRFPNALKIAVFASTNDGHALDVEAGDAFPWQAPGWVKRRLAAGITRPWVYCNRSNRSAVEFELNKAGITTAQVALWVATLDGTQSVPAGPYPVAAVQYANSAHSGGHYDLSIVNEVFGPGGGTIGGADMNSEQDRKLSELHELFIPEGADPTPVIGQRGKLAYLMDGGAQLAAILKAIQGLQASGLSPAQAQQLAHIETMLTGGLKGT